MTRIRRERQEYPNKRFDEAIHEKLPTVFKMRAVLKMPRQLVNREEQGKLIAQTSGAVTMINESNCIVRSKSGYNKYIYRTCNPIGMACSCPDHICRDIKCKYVYAVEFYRHQNATY